MSKCLASDDPLSQEVAWGVLEGDLVTLRRERSARKATQSWYLLLPVAGEGREAVSEETEKDLDFVADSLTYLEFTIGDEARDIATDLEEVGTRQALWGGTLDGVSSQVNEALLLSASVRPGDRHKISLELWETLALLHRWRALMEKIHSDAAQILRKYQGYLDSTEDFVRRRLTFSFPLPAFLRSLGDALLDAYPYHYLQEPLKILENHMAFLHANITNIITSMDAALSEAEQQARSTQEQAMQRLSLVLALLALLIGVPQLIPSAAISKANYPLWLSRFLPLDALESGTRILVAILLVLLAAVFGEVAFRWLLSWFSQPDRFLKHIQQLWALVDEAAGASLRTLKLGRGVLLAGKKGFQQRLEQLDEQACSLVVELWEELQETEKPLSELLRLLGWLERRSPQVEAWLRRNRRLRYHIDLFDLRPENIPLPRTLCVFRYKSTDFHTRTVISDWEFSRSLRLAGFESEEADLLQEWLSEMENQRVIQQMEVRTFVNALKERGVTADPANRTPKNWRGMLGEA